MNKRKLTVTILAFILFSIHIFGQNTISYTYDSAGNRTGRHPNEYHDFVLQTMYLIDTEAAGDTQKFLNLFDIYIKQVVLDNPELLRKSGWRF